MVDFTYEDFWSWTVILLGDLLVIQLPYSLLICADFLFFHHSVLIRYVCRNLSISSKLSNLLGLLFIIVFYSLYFCGVCCNVSCFTYNFIWVNSFFFNKFVNFVYFSKKPSFIHLFCVFLTSISFTSTLILVIPFLLLTLGFVVLFLVSWGVRLCCFRPFQVIGMTEILQVINIFCRVILFWRCENLCFRNT